MAARFAKLLTDRTPAMLGAEGSRRAPRPDAPHRAQLAADGSGAR
jgi:hypothetical protein